MIVSDNERLSQSSRMEIVVIRLEFGSTAPNGGQVALAASAVFNL